LFFKKQEKRAKKGRKAASCQESYNTTKRRGWNVAQAKKSAHRQKKRARKMAKSSIGGTKGPARGSRRERSGGGRGYLGMHILIKDEI